MINTNMKCVLSAVVGAGLGYYAARTILERNYTISVSNAFHDARGYNGPGYKKTVTITVQGEVTEMAEYSAEGPAADDEAAPTETLPTVGDVIQPAPPEMFTPMYTPAANQAIRNYQGLDLNTEAREQHVREDFMEELQQKIDGVRTDEEDGYGKSPLSGGSTPVFLPPFRISEIEYGEGIDGYDSLTMIYHEGDGVLTDHLGERMAPIAAEEALGDIHNLPFGIESSDGNICYIRCPQLSTDFEVIRSEGKYSESPSSGGID